MKPRLVDLSKGDTRNMERGPDGRLYSRRGFRRVYDPTDATIIAGHSVKHPLTERTWHYLVVVDSTGVKVRVIDEDQETLEQEFTVGVASARTVTFCVVQNQLFISSPDFATVWSWLGGSLAFCRSKPSVNEGTTTLEDPRGLSVSWAGGRRVVAKNGLLYFSDALAPRTFVAQNVLYGDWASPIYGLHVSAEGMLVVAAESGVWALPESASAAGQIVLGQWSKLTTFRALDYGVTVETRGQVWGATRDGVRRLVPDGEEVKLWEAAGIRAADATALSVFGAVEVRDIDMRDGRLVAYADGLCVAVDRKLRSLFHVVNIAQGFRSWWSAPNHLTDGTLVGTMMDHRGDDLFLFGDGVTRLRGNFDGDDGLNSAAGAQPSGYMSTSVDDGPGDSTVLREVRVESNSLQGVKMSVNGIARAAESVPTRAPKLGAATWDDDDDAPAPGL